MGVRRITAVELWAADADASARFYREVVGVDLGESHAHEPENLEHHETMFGSFEDDSYVFFTILPARDRPTAQVGFRVDDLDAVHARAVDAGVTVVRPPHDEPWGRSAQYRDPDGTIVSVTQA